MKKAARKMVRKKMFFSVLNFENMNPINPAVKRCKKRTPQRKIFPALAKKLLPVKLKKNSTIKKPSPSISEQERNFLLCSVCAVSL